ncbi:MAG: M48 family metallopeptidase, partial [Gemmataceae bacterium]|nr:M48 family metallopeptidase [Gemmataceae bacterium]
MKNFFEHQQLARQRTKYLVFLYGIAVAGTVLLTYFVVWAIFYLPTLDPERLKTASGLSVSGIPLSELFEPQLFLLVTGTTVLLIGGMTALKLSELSSGGKAVAEMLGGRLVTTPTSDFHEKRLLNVVEEMAIASGIPVPPVYVLDGEGGINAFAAGYAPDQAVIGVSRGALEYLNRDELQGVIAHEFSHILNGDMRLNIRLIAIIFGIMGLAAFGSILLRTRSRNDKGAGQIILLGLGLYLLGIVGAFVGNIIKAMVSRQREFLADASAVQFTRNPDGIGGALKKIGGLKDGAAIRNEHAPEAAHMFFADALSRLTDLFATHPPLPERIRRIDPKWDGTFPKVTRPIRVDAAEVEAEKKA